MNETWKAIIKKIKSLFSKREKIVVYRNGKVYKCKTFLEAFAEFT